MAYSKEHSDHITDNWSAITNEVEMRDIVDLLIQKRVISSQDWDDMKRAHPLTKDQMHVFLTFLQKKPKAYFKKFIEALRESEKYDHIVVMLETSLSRNQPFLQDQNLFNPTNFKRLWEEVHTNKKEYDRKLEATNKEISNLKILLARKENEIKRLKERNQKKEEKIEKLSNDVKAETRQRKAAESKLKLTEGNLEMVRRENTELLILSRQTTETERLLREKTELKLHRTEVELARLRENTELLSLGRQDTKTESEKRFGKEAEANKQMTNNELPTAHTKTAKSFSLNPQSEQNITPKLPEVEPFSALEKQIEQLTKQLQGKTRKREELERKLKTSIVCSIL